MRASNNSEEGGEGHVGASGGSTEIAFIAPGSRAAAAAAPLSQYHTTMNSFAEGSYIFKGSRANKDNITSSRRRRRRQRLEADWKQDDDDGHDDSDRQGSRPSGGGCTSLLDLRFSNRHYENLFVVYLCQDWSSRIGLSVGLSIVVLISVLQGLYDLSIKLFIATMCVWLLAAVLFALLRLSVWRAHRGQSNVLLVVDTHAMSQGVLTEYVTIVLLYGGAILFTLAIVLSALTCPVDDAIQHTECLDRHVFDTLGMLVFLFMCILAPVRTGWIALMAILNIAALVLSFVWVGLNAHHTFTSKMYAATALYVAQVTACVVLAYFREVEQRKTLLLRVEQEEAMQQTEAVRRLSAASATRHIPDHVVRSLSVSGAYEAEGESVVVGFALTNFVWWCAGRGPRDTVSAVADFVEACENGMRPLFSDAAVNAVELPMLGDTVMFVFLLKSGGGQLAGDSIVDRIYSTTLTAVDVADKACYRITNPGGAANPMLTPSSQCCEPKRAEVSLSSRSGPCSNSSGDCPSAPVIHHHRHLLRLFPMCAITAGVSKVWYAASCSVLISTGAAVVECRSVLQELSNVEQHQPRLHLAASMTAGATPAHTSELTTATSSAQSYLRSLSTLAQKNTASNGSIAATSKIDAAPPSDGSSQRAIEHGSSSNGSTHLEAEFELSTWIPRFVVAETELAFSEQQRSSFDLKAVTINAASMLGISISMIVVCFLYKEMNWEVRSPLPYIVGCGAVSIVQFLCSQHGVLQKHATLLDVCCWLFCALCLAASAVTPQSDSIFGQSLFPWCVVAITVSLQRPLWSGPLTMWSLELCVCIFVSLCVLLPTRSYTTSISNFSIRIVIPGTVLLLVVRWLMDQRARAHFKWSRMLVNTHESLQKECSHLIVFLDSFMPNRVAKVIIDRRMADRNTISWLHMQHRSALISAMEDQAFAFVQWQPVSPPLEEEIYPPRTSLPAEAAPPPTMSHRTTTVGFEQTRRALDSVVASMNTYAGVVRIVKTDGDCVQLTTDDEAHGRTLGWECAKMIDAVLHVKNALRRECFEVRSIVGVCPMVGAVMGKHAPSFEWFAAEVHAAMRVLRCSDGKIGPVHWGDVGCTERAVYYIFQCGMEEGRERSIDKEDTWWLVKQENLQHARVCGSPRLRVARVIQQH